MAATEEINNKLDQETFGERPCENSSPTIEEDHHCNLCRNKLCSPRVLSCLHVFCESCLDKLLMDETGDPKKKDNVIQCPKCKQETKIGSKNASSLPIDYVTSNILDMDAVKSMTVLCTSCKSAEKAISRCADCANFLCPNCNTAHELMRCFENHHVFTLEDLRKSSKIIPIHKPVLCSIHPTEQVKFFCLQCQVSTCSECIGEHKIADHPHERILEAEIKQREELKNLIQESRTRVLFCDDVSNTLGNALNELQFQYDNAKDLIHETFQSYKAVLEKRRDDVLKELDKLHKVRELEIMELFNCIEKTGNRMEDACKFARKLVELGDAAEILTLKNVVGTQLLNLINNTPKPDVNVALEFETNLDAFAEAVKVHFGKFKPLNPPISNTSSPSPKETSSPPNSLQFNGNGSLAHLASNSISGFDLGSGLNLSNSAMSISNGGIMSGGSGNGSSPTSLKSSYDGGDLSSSFTLAPVVLNPDIPHSQVTTPLTPSTLHGLTSIQEYNLQQLASLAEKADLEAATGSSNPSPTPPFNIAELFSGDFSSSNAIHNLQALAKLTLNNQDVVANGTLNGASTVNGGLVLSRGGTSPILDQVPKGPLSLNTALAPLNTSPYPNLPTPNSPIIRNTDVNGLNPSVTGINSYPHPRVPNSKMPPMEILYKFGQLGPSKAQFNSPHGFCLGTEEDIIVADTNNHRIQIFEKNGSFKFQFGIPGKDEGQLWFPRKVAVMRSSGKFVVCDRGNERSRMQIFTKSGHFLKKIAIRYIDIVAGLAVTSQGHIVAVDSVSPTVFVIAETGELLRWFDCSEYMREPSDIAINGKEYYVCDFKGHCVVVFSDEGAFLRRIGCENITNFPNGIDVSDAGDVLVGDSHGNRFHVAVFNREGTMLSEFECPHVKVSRCCGLKITSEGYVVTLAKNNHHVLVLNTLYIF
ncbi:UNVERIFIED_CONTAM: hypothetical protein PYX00_006065 [Menopon gallinae]|uniref:Brain tumor protein n=1 Tax=Menopon gallinae TaxID=328185 RepID=A0AAW2HUW8_9NEOP